MLNDASRERHPTAFTSHSAIMLLWQSARRVRLDTYVYTLHVYARTWCIKLEEPKARYPYSYTYCYTYIPAAFDHVRTHMHSIGIPRSPVYTLTDIHICT